MILRDLMNMSIRTVTARAPRGVIYEADRKEKTRVASGYVFVCSSWTEGECLDKRLFGLPDREWKRVSQIKEGDILFLLNYMTGHLHGVFEASSDGILNIDPNAWGGRFPAQVKVRILIKCPYVTKAELLPLIRRRWITISRKGVLFFPDKLGPKFVEELLRIFLRIPPIPRTEQSNAGNISTDGHIVRSHGERLVDDWLHKHLPYPHLYNYAVKRNSETVLCDWYVPEIGLFIEYWEGANPRRSGLEENMEMHLKRRFFEGHSLDAINIYEDDLPLIDKVITQRIREAVPRCRFRKAAGMTRGARSMARVMSFVEF